jgi:hypothetical protein
MVPASHVETLPLSITGDRSDEVSGRIVFNAGISDGAWELWVS